MKKDYTIFTVANKRPAEQYYCFDEFFKSLNGEPVNVLGTTPESYGGLGSKPRLLYEAIKAGHAKTKHIIFCDCFDLVFTSSPRLLFSIYLFCFDSPFVISAEKNCFPSDLKDEYDKLDSLGSPYKYLNSGMIVAETEAMLTVLESMDAKNIPNDYWNGVKMVEPNDQFYYQQEFLKQPVKMELDYNQFLCNTMNMTTQEEIKLETKYSMKQVLNTTTNTYPNSFHFNGGSKTGGLMEPILKHLKLR